jgi:hypothetical protein
MEFLFPVVQSIHIVGLTLMVGTIAIADLRDLGLLGRVSANLPPWTFAGLITVTVTGPVLFFWDRHRYLHNPAFLVKMAILALALLTHFAFPRSSGKHGKLAAVLSLILWSCVVLAGRAIADFDIGGV